jgi:hypothetical protein
MAIIRVVSIGCNELVRGASGTGHLSPVANAELALSDPPAVLLAALRAGHHKFFALYRRETMAIHHNSRVDFMAAGWASKNDHGGHRTPFTYALKWMPANYSPQLANQCRARVFVSTKGDSRRNGLRPRDLDRVSAGRPKLSKRLPSNDRRAHFRTVGTAHSHSHGLKPTQRLLPARNRNNDRAPIPLAGKHHDVVHPNSSTPGRRNVSSRFVFQASRGYLLQAWEMRLLILRRRLVSCELPRLLAWRETTIGTGLSATLLLCGTPGIELRPRSLRNCAATIYPHNEERAGHPCVRSKTPDLGLQPALEPAMLRYDPNGHTHEPPVQVPERKTSGEVRTRSRDAAHTCHARAPIATEAD